MARRPIACVTGATGFLASELVAQLLERGYRVHATVRSLANAERNACLLDLPGATADTLKLFEADLLDDTAFDECVAGAQCVFHTASPFVTSNITDPHRELIAPALTGTRNVFSSIKRAVASGAEPPRVVLTSSVAAVMGTAADKATYFDESDWNFSSRAHGNPPGNGLDMYRYSKALTTHHSPLSTHDTTHGTPPCGHAHAPYTTYWACTCASLRGGGRARGVASRGGAAAPAEHHPPLLHRGPSAHTAHRRREPSQHAAGEGQGGG